MLADEVNVMCHSANVVLEQIFVCSFVRYSFSRMTCKIIVEVSLYFQKPFYKYGLLGVMHEEVGHARDL